MTERSPEKSSRRRLLGGAAGAAGVALGLIAWRTDTAAAASDTEPTSRDLAARPADGPQPLSAPAPQNRGFTSGKFSLEIGNTTAGWVQSVEGGHATSDVVTEKVGPDHIVHKHIAGVKYEDITLRAGAGLSNDFYNWIKGTMAMQQPRPDGAIHACDFDGNIVSTIDWFHGLISEIGFPALDAASKDAAKMTIKFSPELTRFRKDSGKVSSLGGAKQKVWLSSNFRFELGDLDTRKVSKIDAFTVRQQSIQSGFTEGNGPLGVLEIPNLFVTLPLASADTWLQWLEDFVIKGNNGRSQQKSGSLEFLDPTGKVAIFTLALRGVGIFGIVDDEASSEGDESIKRVRVELYCEQMIFDFKAPFA